MRGRRGGGCRGQCAADAMMTWSETPAHSPIRQARAHPLRTVEAPGGRLLDGTTLAKQLAAWRAHLVRDVASDVHARRPPWSISLSARRCCSARSMPGCSAGPGEQRPPPRRSSAARRPHPDQPRRRHPGRGPTVSRSLLPRPPGCRDWSPPRCFALVVTASRTAGCPLASAPVVHRTCSRGRTRNTPPDDARPRACGHTPASRRRLGGVVCTRGTKSPQHTMHGFNIFSG
jgi:hypothetical protein